jgi:hypothetical protein
MTSIITKNRTVDTDAPIELLQGELAVNLNDLILYTGPAGGGPGVPLNVTDVGVTAAVNVTYDNAVSGLTAEQVQAAIDELKVLVDGAGGGGGAIVGEIRAYYGLISALPPFWYECDGLNGTPDLQGRALMGGGDNGIDKGVGGGALPVAGVSGSTSAGVTVNATGNHTHTVDLTQIQFQVGGAGSYNVPTNATTSQNGSHSHSASSPSHNHSTPSGTLPPYQGVFWIMYTGV